MIGYTAKEVPSKRLPPSGRPRPGESQEGQAIETPTKSLLPTLEADRLERFEAYVAAFRPVFHRADQSLRFRAYLRGLLEPSARNNVEAIAAAASKVIMVEANLAQALQHFVSQSPWDSRRLFAAVRQKSLAFRSDPAAVWVIHDGVFPKKGQHSVGVFRQFARSLGKKINCQVGVFISQVGPFGFFPLASRLYLPANWMRDNPELAEKTIPEDQRRPATKAEIALELLDELRQAGEKCSAITAENGYLSVAEFSETLQQRGFLLQDPADDVTPKALRHFQWLKSEMGIDHFEGRTWHGWHHHVSLVFAAYHFLAGEHISPDWPPFTSSPR
ncbi:IS701 family transposase [Limnoglobus roseus]|uniref:Transposase n=1 Tax=Limnoglobus roseus TaxID=2598579 RepID=A0A5C1A755_9BACT|nr:transposase [Limnoglobus roseus]QEL15031.1 transposase [Limnoglobus roseus]